MQRDPSERPGYLGAMLEEEHRLVLVPLDPDRPWAAFRRMRALMKRARPSTAPATVELFEAIEKAAARRAERGDQTGDADVIELRPRAGGS